MPAREAFERVCRKGGDERSLRQGLLDTLRSRVPFDAHAWVLTDPETCVGSSPLAHTPWMADLSRLIRLKYLTPTNRWTELASAAVTLRDATGGELRASRLWDELLAGYGVDDVLSAVFRDQHGVWAFLELWRIDGTFTPGECDLVADLVNVATAALRQSLAATFAAGVAAPTVAAADAEPVVLLLSDDLGVLTSTPPADAYLRSLLPTEDDRAPIPAAAYHVAAQLLAREAGVDEHAPSARVHLRDGVWVTLRAARLLDAAPGGPSIVVSIEPTPPMERSDLYGRVLGLSERERQLLHHLAGGVDTREAAARMFVSEHTVQDHLKSIFAKADVRSRGKLISRATGAG